MTVKVRRFPDILMKYVGDVSTHKVAGEFWADTSEDPGTACRAESMMVLKPKCRNEHGETRSIEPGAVNTGWILGTRLVDLRCPVPRPADPSRQDRHFTASSASPLRAAFVSTVRGVRHGF